MAPVRIGSFSRTPHPIAGASSSDGTADGIARVSFADQGIGISPEHVPHIFERFYRAAAPESGEARSGGLGLAIAQAIANAQGGSIECDTTPGRGSTFTVTLPLTGADP